MAQNPVEYAEKALQVHKVYEEAVAAEAELQTIHNELAQCKIKENSLQQNISDREMDLLSEERGKHPEMSQAGMERHLKLVLHVDTAYREMIRELMEVHDTQTAQNANRSITESKVRVLTARMTELGGYLHYLAAAKESQTANRQS